MQTEFKCECTGGCQNELMISIDQVKKRENIRCPSCGATTVYHETRASELVSAINNRDGEAITLLFHMFDDILRGLCYNTFRSNNFSFHIAKSEAEVAVQNLYLSILKNGLKVELRLDACLYRAATNQTYSRMREVLNKAKPSFMQDVAEVEHQLMTQKYEKTFIQNIDFEKLLSTLSSEKQEVYILRRIEGLREDETSKRLSIPVGTVKSRLSRAEKEISTILRRIQQ